MFENLVDIHSHTLWGMDDGASNFNESMNMCLCAEENETGTLFLTPHLIYWDSAEELYDKREAKVERLMETLDDEESSLVIKKGFEILCDDEIFSIKHFLPYTLNESRYILIEFDFRKTSEDDVASWCKYLKSFGLVPIIAHPERYNFVLDDITSLNRLSDMDVLFQINAGSPAGMFGDEPMEVSCEMLSKGFVDFFGSDAHSLNGRDTDMLSCFEAYPEEIDENMIRPAATRNPDCILNDIAYIPKRLKYL